MMKASEKAVFHASIGVQHYLILLIPLPNTAFKRITTESVSGSVVSGEGFHSLQKVQGQAVLSVVLRKDFNDTANQPAGL